MRKQLTNSDYNILQNNWTGLFKRALVGKLVFSCTVGVTLHVFPRSHIYLAQKNLSIHPQCQYTFINKIEFIRIYNKINNHPRLTKIE